MRLFGYITLAFIALCLGFVYAADDAISFPIVLPPVQQKQASQANSGSGTCLLYAEAITINVFPVDKNSKPRYATAVIGSANSTKNTYAWKPEYANCLANSTRNKGDNKEDQPKTFSFTLDVKAGNKIIAQKSDDQNEQYFSVEGPLKFLLTFNMTRGGYWTLAKVETDGFKITNEKSQWLSQDLNVKKENGTAIAKTVRDMQLMATKDESWACSQTRVAVFATDSDKYHVGVGFEHIQIQPFGATTGSKNNTAIFSPRVADCVGTFTVGSWMGIIVTLVLAAVFMFGYLMLNSVQTIDRFDDPKSKQLLINAKE